LTRVIWEGGQVHGFKQGRQWAKLRKHPSKTSCFISQTPQKTIKAMFDYMN